MSRRAANRELAAWLRAQGIAPTGDAWALAQTGVRDVAALARVGVAVRATSASDTATPAPAPVREVAGEVADTPGTDYAARDVRAGDFLPARGAHVTDNPLTDPTTGETVAPLSDGSELIEAPDAPVRVLRGDAPVTRRKGDKRPAPPHVVAAASAYRDARDAWQARRESSEPAPVSVPGVEGSGVAMYQLTDAEYAAAFPAPVYSDFLRAECASRRAPA